MRGLRLGPKSQAMLMAVMLAVAVARVLGGSSAGPLPQVHHAAAPVLGPQSSSAGG